jgi:uncharacterized phage-associated protein
MEVARISRPSIRFVFDRKKAGELAAALVQLAGGSMPMLKLLKLMYLADRTSLIETGFPITGDDLVAMGNGPVLSTTYDGLKPRTTVELPYVSNATGSVRIIEAPPAAGQLSDYEIELARRVWAKFGHMTGQQLITFLHREAHEWKPPAQGSSASAIRTSIIRPPQLQLTYGSFAPSRCPTLTSASSSASRPISRTSAIAPVPSRRASTTSSSTGASWSFGRPES